jgi:hypothetical protein
MLTLQVQSNKPLPSASTAVRLALKAWNHKPLVYDGWDPAIRTLGAAPLPIHDFYPDRAKDSPASCL